MKQALTSLLNNVVRTAPQGGAVLLQVMSLRQAIRFVIKDQRLSSRPAAQHGEASRAAPADLSEHARLEIALASRIHFFRPPHGGSIAFANHIREACERSLRRSQYES